jgi:hypothetical protein
MRLVDSISRTVNYGMTSVDHAVKKIAGTPSAVKKVLQIAGKTFAAFDLYTTGETRKRDITQVMKGTTDLIEFYGSYKNLMYWVNLFSKESIDQQVLQESIDSSLSASHLDQTSEKMQKKLARDIFDEVMAKEAYHSKGEVIDAIKASLISHGYNQKKAKQVAARVIVKQKVDSPVKLFYMACFTVADLGGNILTLKKWNILDLSKLAATIGSQSRVFMFVINLGADTVLGVIGSAGIAVALGEASYKAMIHASKLYSTATTMKEKDEAYKELRNAFIDIAGGVTDLVATAAPLFFALNPPTLIALALVSKGTGLVCFLIK